MPSCYLAAPLFSDAERAFNEALAHLLERRMSVFLPQRDGRLLRDMLNAGEALESARRKVYLADTAAIARADLVIAVLDGPAIDDGVAFELGFARGLGKCCIGLATDSRRAAPYFQNPMWQEALAEMFASVSALEDWINQCFVGDSAVDRPLREDEPAPTGGPTQERQVFEDRCLERLGHPR